MAFVVKGGASLKKMDKKSAYTWGASALIFIFVLMTMFSAMGGESKADEFEGLQSRALDLAQLSSITDEAQQAILANYNDIVENPVEEAEQLYSEEDREARIAADQANGEPEADEEYAAAMREAKEREARAAAMRSNSASSRSSTPRPPTQIGSLVKGGGFSSSGGGRGGNASYNPNSNNNSFSKRNNQKVSASKDALDKLKNTGLTQAHAMTTAAANKTGEGAARGAAEAFQAGKSEADLNTDLEKAYTKIGENAIPNLNQTDKGGSNNTASKIDDKLKDNQKKNDAAAKNNNNNSNGQCNEWYCMFLDIGKTILTSAAQTGSDAVINKYIGKQKTCLNLVKEYNGSFEEKKSCLSL